MKKYIVWSFLLLIMAAFVNAQEISLKENWRALADSEAYKGQIKKTQINPADSTWISFEVHNNEKIDLYIVNTTNNKARQLNYKIKNADMDDEFGTASDVNRDLAWCPVKKGSDLWCAFVGDAMGSMQLFLYNISKDKYFYLKSAFDSTGSSNVLQPSWSPDGQYLTYVSSAKGDLDIYMIEDMNSVLNDPENPVYIQKHNRIITGKGDQIYPTWCPVDYAGYIAYTHKEKDKLFQIKVYDLKSSKSYELISPETDRNYFAPSWNVTGKKIAFYQSFDTPTGTYDNSEGDKYELGLASVTTLEDSLIIRQISGGRAKSEINIVSVAPNNDRFIPPAWLANEFSLIVPIYNEAEGNPIREVNSKMWELSGVNRSSWLKTPPGTTFNFAKDINIVNSTITFTYAQGQSRSLLYGQLEPISAFLNKNAIQLNSLEINNSRKNWYKSRIEKPGIIEKVWTVLKTPFIGNKGYFANTPGGVLAIGGALLILTGGNPGPEPTPKRTWNVPSFETKNNQNNNSGFSISVSF